MSNLNALIMITYIDQQEGKAQRRSSQHNGTPEEAMGAEHGQVVEQRAQTVQVVAGRVQGPAQEAEQCQQQSEQRHVPCRFLHIGGGRRTLSLE
jgi:hypothetical protein